MNSTVLSIESRDCITSPENYSIVVTINDTDTKLLNVTFNSNIQYDVGDQLMPNIQYIIRTVIIEMTSSTVIDENITIIMYSTSTDPTGYSLYMHVSSIMHVHVSMHFLVSVAHAVFTKFLLYVCIIASSNWEYNNIYSVCVCVCVLWWYRCDNT